MWTQHWGCLSPLEGKGDSAQSGRAPCTWMTVVCWWSIWPVICHCTPASVLLLKIRHWRLKVHFTSWFARKVSGHRLLVMEWIDALGPASDAAALQKANLKPSDIMRTATQAGGCYHWSHVAMQPIHTIKWISMNSATLDGLWQWNNRNNLLKDLKIRSLGIRSSALGMFIVIPILATCWCGRVHQDHHRGRTPKNRGIKTANRSGTDVQISSNRWPGGSWCSWIMASTANWIQNYVPCMQWRETNQNTWCHYVVL